MQNSEVFFTIFKDSFFSNFAITLDAEFAYKGALMMGKTDPLLATGSAFAGSILGLFASFMLFYGFAMLMKKILEKNPGYEPARHYISKFSPLIAILFLFPELSIIASFFLGVTRLKISKFIILAVIYKIIFYTYTVSTTNVLFS